MYHGPQRKDSFQRSATHELTVCRNLLSVLFRIEDIVFRVEIGQVFLLAVSSIDRYRVLQNPLQVGCSIIKLVSIKISTYFQVN